MEIIQQLAGSAQGYVYVVNNMTESYRHNCLKTPTKFVWYCHLHNCNTFCMSSLRIPYIQTMYFYHIQPQLCP